MCAVISPLFIFERRSRAVFPNRNAAPITAAQAACPIICCDALITNYLSKLMKRNLIHLYNVLADDRETVYSRIGGPESELQPFP